MSTKRSVINIILSVACFALAVVALIIMIKGTGVRVVPKSSEDWASGRPKDYTCMTVAFGEARAVVENAFEVSPPLCFELFLLILGAFFILFTVFDNIVKRRIRLIFSVVATLCFIGAGVLFSLNGRLFVLGEYFYKRVVLEAILLDRITLKIGWGAITAGILSFVASAIIAVKCVLTAFKVL